jgi:hypothetical protein
VPRWWHYWLNDLLHPVPWKNAGNPWDWLQKLRALAKSYDCRLIFDPRHHWKESRYCRNRDERSPTILAGGAGDRRFVCAAILHELGHHILVIRHQHPAEALKGELAAWDVAHSLAEEHHLPLLGRPRRIALRSYREGIESERTAGSKRKNRRRQQPRSWRLEDSRRSAQVSNGGGLYAMGKKGKRHAKRYLKKATTRAERRPQPEEE